MAKYIIQEIGGNRETHINGDGFLLTRSSIVVYKTRFGLLKRNIAAVPVGTHKIHEAKV